MSYPSSPFSPPLTVTASSLLATIAETETRLAFMRQQLSYELQQLQGQGQGQVQGQGQGQGQGYPVGRASIQLQGAYSGRAHGAISSTMGRRPYPGNRPLSASARPFVPASSSASASASAVRQPKKPFEVISVPLSSILHPQEVVTFRILLGKSDARLHAVFDGTSLQVSECEHAPSVIGMISQKPGEILYRFMEALKESGVLKRSFTVAPWRLCSVVREGKEETLEELRRKFLQSQENAGHQARESRNEEVQQVEEAL